MKSIRVLITKCQIVICPECRDKQGLRATSPPYVTVDLSQPPVDVGQLVRSVLVMSSLDSRTNPTFVSDGNELLHAIGVRSWADLRKRAASARIEDNDMGTLDLTPSKPSGGGWSGVGRAAVRIPIGASPQEVGEAFSDLVKKARKYAGF